MSNRELRYKETEELIKKLINGNPLSAVGLLILSINNVFNKEIAQTITKNPPQPSLLFIGVHSVALTISEVLFNERGLKGYKKFLEEFVDGNPKNKQFSLIADQIHSWRNILVHGWLSLKGHKMEYDFKMIEGYKNRDGTLYINPKIYLGLYLSAFNGRIMRYVSKMKQNELIRAQNTIKLKYIR